MSSDKPVTVKLRDKLIEEGTNFFRSIDAHHNRDIGHVQAEMVEQRLPKHNYREKLKLLNTMRSNQTELEKLLTTTNYDEMRVILKQSKAQLGKRLKKRYDLTKYDTMTDDEIAVTYSKLCNWYRKETDTYENSLH